MVELYVSPPSLPVFMGKEIKQQKKWISNTSKESVILSSALPWKETVCITRITKYTKTKTKTT